MYGYLSELHQKLVFTKDDLVATTGSKDRAAALLLSYQRKNLITKIRRNLYCVTNLSTGAPEASKMQIASAVSPTAAVAYHAAMEYHGVAHQVFYELCVVSATRFTPFEFDGTRFVYVRNPLEEGVMQPEFGGGVRVTDLERTVLDCIDRIDLCGGVEELLHCLEAVAYVDETKLIRYLRLYGKASLFKKAGYVLALTAVGRSLTSDFYALCHKASERSTGVLTTLEPCERFVGEWRLYVPEWINSEIQPSGHDTLR